MTYIDEENEDYQELVANEEAWFYHALRDFEAIVRNHGIGEVMAALDDPIVFEIYRHLGVDPE